MIETMTDLQRHFGPQLIAIAVIMLVSVVAAYAVRHRRHSAFGLNPAATCLALGSALAIAAATLSRRDHAWAPGQLQLEPFHTLRGYRHDSSELMVYLGGNIALFVPLGFFLYLTLGRRILASTICCTLGSIAVEILQVPIWSRSTDIDDVLTNSLGGSLGALVGFFFMRRFATARRSTGPGQPPRRVVA
jgi:VanZ like family